MNPEKPRNFSIAYSIVTHQGAGLVERILRAIYRPQNVYCIHVDTKSDSTFYNALRLVSECFPNVFLAQQRVDVVQSSLTL